MKRQCEYGRTIDNNGEDEYETYRKWKRDLDKELKTVTWLECETVIESGRKVVRARKCSICSKYKSRI